MLAKIGLIVARNRGIVKIGEGWGTKIPLSQGLLPKLDFDKLLPSGRRDGWLFAICRTLEPFDTHVSKFLLNVYRSYDQMDPPRKGKCLGKIWATKSILAKVWWVCKHKILEFYYIIRYISEASQCDNLKILSHCFVPTAAKPSVAVWPLCSSIIANYAITFNEML